MEENISVDTSIFRDLEHALDKVFLTPEELENGHHIVFDPECVKRSIQHAFIGIDLALRGGSK